MKTFIVDSSNSLFTTSGTLPTQLHRLTIESNILSELESDNSGECCIIYPSLSRLLANSIAATGQVARSQNHLLIAVEQLVQFYKRNRACCKLLYLDKQNIAGQNNSALSSLMELQPQVSTKYSDIAELIAASSLLAHKEFSKRLAELESCSYGAVSFELQVNAQHGVDEIFELQNENKQKLAAAETEVAGLKSELAKEQQARLTELKAAEKIQKEKDKQLQALEQENEEIIKQLHYVQELIEQEFVSNTQQQKQIKALSEERSTLLKQLEEGRLIQEWLRRALVDVNYRLWLKNRTFRKEINRYAKMLQESSEFVTEQYIEMYPDIKNASLKPEVHYLLFGAVEGRNPSNTFHSFNYIKEYADVAESGQNPLLHFIRWGQFQGRKSNPLQLRLPAPKA